MKLAFSERAWEDYLYWQKTDRKTLEKLNQLLKEISRHPFTGEGKPEPMKHQFTGWWSRRIGRENRLVYRVEEGMVYVMQCRFHYEH
ncbi:MAG: Txe/YoeB family addiction module toxin [Verrucomicrobiota bacterium]